MVVVALPGLRLNHYQTAIAQDHGFLTFPSFMDNHFIEKKGSADLKWLDRMLRRFSLGAIRFCIAPDYNYEEMHRLKKLHPDINWIFPLHSRRENFSEFEWIAYPHRKQLRDYDLGWFLKNTEDKKRWYLGFWNESNPHIIKKFDGLDTTIPSYYATRLGLIWYGWGNSEPANQYLERRELFIHNVLRLKMELLKILESSLQQPLVTQFVTDKGEGYDGK